MADLLFSMFEKPTAIHFPPKGIVVIEISVASSRDGAPIVTAQVAPAAEAINLGGGAEGTPIPDPLVAKYLKDNKTWTHGAAINTHSSEGGTGFRNVYFINLGYVKSQLPKGQHEWKFTMHTPGNTDGTTTTGCLTAVKYFVHYKWLDNRPGSPTQGEKFGPFVKFDFLPGNGFAVYVYEFMNGGATNAAVLSNPSIVGDAASSVAAAIAAAKSEAPEGFEVVDIEVELVVDFIVPETFVQDDILFMDIRTTTWSSRKDFPVVKGEAAWDVEEADGTARVKLFGDSGGAKKLTAHTITWTVQFPDLEVGAALDSK